MTGCITLALSYIFNVRYFFTPLSEMYHMLVYLKWGRLVTIAVDLILWHLVFRIYDGNSPSAICLHMYESKSFFVFFFFQYNKHFDVILPNVPGLNKSCKAQICTTNLQWLKRDALKYERWLTGISIRQWQMTAVSDCCHTCTDSGCFRVWGPHRGKYSNQKCHTCATRETRCSAICLC